MHQFSPFKTPGFTINRIALRLIRSEQADMPAYKRCRWHREVDVAVFAAAVADFTPEKTAGNKIKRGKDELSLKLTPTKDIAADMGKVKTDKQVFVGFALETEEGMENAKKKLEEADKLEEINIKIQKKLESYQELYDSNQRLIYLGQKVNDIAEKYFNNKQKRELMAELFKVVQIENSKRKKVSAKQQKVIKAKENQVKQEAEKKVEVIRKKKKAEKQKAIELPKPKAIIKLGDRVRMYDGRAIGTIDKIEKNKAVVNYGVFTTNVNIDQLELVEAIKK